MTFLQKRWPGPALVVFGIAVISVFWFVQFLQAIGVVIAVIGLGWSFKRFGVKAIPLLLLVWAAFFARAYVAREQERSAPRRYSDEDYRNARAAKAKVEKRDHELLVANAHALTGQMNFCVSITVQVEPRLPMRRCDLSEAFWETLSEGSEHGVRFVPDLGFRFEEELLKR